jgi:putative DNA primase/helicase
MSDARRIRSALAYIKPDDWDTCVLVAKGIKHGLGDAGFEIWDEWVRQGGWFGSKATWQAPHDWIPPEERSHGL